MLCTYEIVTTVPREISSTNKEKVGSLRPAVSVGQRGAKGCGERQRQGWDKAAQVMLKKPVLGMGEGDPNRDSIGAGSRRVRWKVADTTYPPVG